MTLTASRDKINHLKARDDSLRKLDIEALPSRDPEREVFGLETDNNPQAGSIQALVIKKTTMIMNIKIVGIYDKE
jgi:hypothetical protein